MTKLYLTRHGETIWNTIGKFQGWSNSDLTELGVKQAKWLAQRMKDLKIDIIYSSPSGRAYDTAIIVKGDRNLEVITCDGLKELNVGVWEGNIQEDIKNDSEENHYNFWNKPSGFIPPEGAESFYDIKKRSFNTIMDIVKNNEGKNILVVTHTITIKSFMCALQDRDIDTLWHEPFVKQTSLTEIDFVGNEYKILLNADIAHHEYAFKEFNEFK